MEPEIWLKANGWTLKGKLWESPYGWPDPMTLDEAVDFEKCCQTM